MRINKIFLILSKCSIKQDISYLSQNSDWGNIVSEGTFRKQAILNNEKKSSK